MLRLRVAAGNHACSEGRHASLAAQPYSNAVSREQGDGAANPIAQPG